MKRGTKRMARPGFKRKVKEAGGPDIAKVPKNRQPIARKKAPRKPSKQIERKAFRTTRPVKDSRRWIKAELDKETSRIVIKRDGKCSTCPAIQNLECGHYFGRAYIPTRWDLKNCNAQCHDCNQHHNRNRKPYKEFMIKKYGADEVSRLDRLRFDQKKRSDEELKELLAQYRQM